MNYLKDLKMRGVKAANKVQEDFKEKDWLLDTQARTWTHLGKRVILLERNDTTTRQTLLSKIMLQAVKARLPSDKTAQANIDEIYEAKNAMQSRMA
jgi:hypothetical protein